MTTDKEKILDLAATHLDQHHEILFAYCHGSFVGDGPFNDIDIAIFLEPDFVSEINFTKDADMNSTPDIRWQQRFKNYQKALAQLRRFISREALSELEEQGLIKAFEYTYELAWTTLKDFLEYQGHTGIYGSRDAIRKAFELDLVQDGQGWMDMLESRNMTSHTYNEAIAREICRAVQTRYFRLLEQLEKNMKALTRQEGRF